MADALTGLATDARNSSLFFADRLDLDERLRVGVAGRFNRTEVRLRDQLGTALDGDHDFERFNPAANLIYRFDAAHGYLRCSESSRVPSPVELTCADEDDIIFISDSSLTNEGYFDNVGRTRRVRVELNLAGRYSKSLHWFLNYGCIEASFRDDFTVSSPKNPAAIGGEIAVRRGDRLPLVPEQLLKAGFEWTPAARVRVGIDLQATSDRHLRGDEGNDVGAIPGYAVVNARGSYSITESLRAFVGVSNLLDAEFETFGLFGEAEDGLGEEFDDSRLLSPGTPRGAWIGLALAIE